MRLKILNTIHTLKSMRHTVKNSMCSELRTSQLLQPKECGIKDTPHTDTLTHTEKLL
jgi:hypothetical protein